MHSLAKNCTLSLLFGLAVIAHAAGPAQISIQAGKPLFRLSELMIGANMEDLHYQMTGGLSSQLIHGESFYEPTPTEVARACQPFDGWTARGGEWTLKGNELSVFVGGSKPTNTDEVPAAAGVTGKGVGARLSLDGTTPENVDITTMEIRFPTGAAGTAGLAFCIQPNQADDKWEWYSGYTLELDPKAQTVVLKKATRANQHREIASAECKIPVDEWIRFSLYSWKNKIGVSVNGEPLLKLEDLSPLPRGQMALVSRDNVRFRRLSQDTIHKSSRIISFHAHPLLTRSGDAINLRWAKVQTGSAKGSFALVEKGAWHPGKRSQTITFTSGEGELGIDNAGLCRWGIDVKNGKPYDGFLRIKSDSPAEVWVSLRSADNKQIYSAQKLTLKGTGEYERIPFVLTPNEVDPNGHFAITLKQPGSVTVGYAFLQPGEWGRYKGLPIRKDLAEAIVGQGIRVLRMNGGMIERPDYRWANMQGPRDQRPPYDGFYDRWCSNGFGVIEFLQFCDAAGLTGITGLNLDETPEAFADLVAYANAPSHTPAGQRRTADGHPAPFNLKYLQVANESRFDQKYVEKFKAVAEAVWKIDPEITLVTTGNVYSFKGNEDEAAMRKRFAMHLEIVRFMHERGKKLLIDCHAFNTGDDPGAARGGAVAGAANFSRWLTRLAPECGVAPVGLLEFNAGRFDFLRGLAHATEMNVTHRNGDVVRGVGTPNLSQPWGVYQTDWKAVLWTQGNIYYTPNKVWFQPAYYVDQMIARHWAPDALSATVSSPNDALDVYAGKSADGKKLVLRVVNLSAEPVEAKIAIDGFTPKVPDATVEQLIGELTDFNTLDNPEKIKPTTRTEPHGFTSGTLSKTFPSHSFTVIKFQ